MSSTASGPHAGPWQLVLVLHAPLVVACCPDTPPQSTDGGAVRPWATAALRPGSRGTPIAHPQRGDARIDENACEYKGKMASPR
jgi:hypothetical protein